MQSYYALVESKRATLECGL